MSAIRRIVPRPRVLPALLALAANLIAAGVPVLHGLAHQGHHGDAHHAVAAAAVATVDHADHEHDEVHPAALHDDASSRGSGGVSFAFVVAADVPPPAATLHERRDTPIPVPRMSSRAPPPGDPARAPPLA